MTSRRVDIDKWFLDELNNYMLSKHFIGVGECWIQMCRGGWSFSILSHNHLSIFYGGGYGKITHDGSVIDRVPYGDPEFFERVLSYLESLK